MEKEELNKDVVEVVVAKDYGTAKAGDTITCHKNLLPYLEKGGIIETSTIEDDTANRVVKKVVKK